MTLPTHFISVIKSYLYCGNQHQSWRAVTTRLNMFSGLQFSFLQFNFINRNVSCNEYPEFISVVECAFSGGFTQSSNRERFSFCWIGFARVTILNIRKSNGVTLPFSLISLGLGISFKSDILVKKSTQPAICVFLSICWD